MRMGGEPCGRYIDPSKPIWYEMFVRSISHAVLNRPITIYLLSYELMRYVGYSIDIIFVMHPRGLP